MSVTKVGTAAEQVENSGINTVTVTNPGFSNGNIIIAKWESTGGVLTSAPSGFVSITSGTDGGGTSFYCGYKLTTGSEPGTYVFTGTGARGLAKIQEYSGQDNTTPVPAGLVSSANATTTMVTASVTPPVDGCYRCITFNSDVPSNVILTPPTGFADVGTNPLSVTGQICTADYDKALGVGTGGVLQPAATLVFTSGTSGRQSQFIIQPAAAGYNLTAAQGSYSLTGQSANLLANRVLSAVQGSYTLTGQTASLSYSTASVLTAGQGSYLLIGSDALVDTSFNAETGFYTLTGFAANLVYTPLNVYNLVATQGSYTLTGFAVNLLESRVLVAAQGQYNLTGQFNTMIWSGAPVVVGGQNRSINISKLRIGL